MTAGEGGSWLPRRAAFYSAPRLPLLYVGDRDLRQAIHDAVSEGLLTVVDGAGTEVAVTAPHHVNLTSTGLRLAKPQQPANDGDGSGIQGTAAGSGAATGTQRPATGDESTIGDGPTASGEHGADARARDKQVAFSFTSNLLASPDSADGFAGLFRDFYIAHDERQISYLQGTIQLVVQADAAEHMQERLNQLGIKAAIKEL